MDTFLNPVLSMLFGAGKDGAEAPLSTVDAADLTAPRAAAATTVAANGSGSGGGGAGRVDSILAAAKRASLAAQSSSISCVPEVR